MRNCDNCANQQEDKQCEHAFDCVGEFLSSSGENTVSKHWKPRDTVNHPSHYETGKFECFDVMVEAIGLEETKGFCLCNAFKYIYRCNSKHETPIEDVKKAIWYLDKFLELEGENGEQS